MKTMTINVTQEHIDRGTMEDCEHCPVALAINEAIPGTRSDVGGNQIYIGNYHCTSREIQTPEVVRQFIARYDSDVLVKPFSFTIEL